MEGWKYERHDLINIVELSFKKKYIERRTRAISLNMEKKRERIL